VKDNKEVEAKIEWEKGYKDSGWIDNRDHDRLTTGEIGVPERKPDLPY
jgi:hypothetical protein